MWTHRQGVFRCRKLPCKQHHCTASLCLDTSPAKPFTDVPDLHCVVQISSTLISNFADGFPRTCEKVRIGSIIQTTLLLSPVISTTILSVSWSKRPPNEHLIEQYQKSTEAVRIARRLYSQGSLSATHIPRAGLIRS